MARERSGIVVAAAALLLLLGVGLTLSGQPRADDGTADAAGSAPIPSGTYAGTVWSAGSTLPVITRFDVSPAGEVSGSYQFQEEDRVLCGILVACHVTPDGELGCRWQDAYGSGNLEVTFADAGATFAGTWSADGDPDLHDWDGERAERIPDLQCEFGSDL
jgi:hypothetical protein